MSRIATLQPEAAQEITEAYAWYEARINGLGKEFIRAVDETLANITRNPELYPLVHRHVRRGLLRRFPYGVFFLIETERIVVLAVFHARRDPQQWQSRAPC